MSIDQNQMARNAINAYLRIQPQLHVLGEDAHCLAICMLIRGAHDGYKMPEGWLAEGLKLVDRIRELGELERIDEAVDKSTPEARQAIVDSVMGELKI